jgi:hypothetical protein
MSLLPSPSTITYSHTATGCRLAVAAFPLETALQGRHLPNLEHAGVIYVPYTGTVVTPARTARYQRPVGFYMEYRALRPMPQRA